MPQAVNPYNFVPFGGVPARKALDEYYADPASLLTGWIDVAVIAKTPVIVPDGAKYREELPGGETDEEKAHKIYTFFQKPDGRYAIPGSGIRGVLRSAYEAVTNSCLPFVMDNKPISQRMPLYSAFPYHGLLGYDAAGGRWNLYQAQEYCYRTTKASVSHGVFRMPHGHIDFHTGDHVQFRLGSNGDIQDMLPYHAPMPRGWREGWLQFNIPVSGIRRGVPLPYYVRVLVSTGTVLHSCPVGGNVQDAELYQSIYYPLYDTVAGKVFRLPMIC